MDTKKEFVLPNYSVKKTGIAKINDKKKQRQKIYIDTQNFLRKGHKITVIKVTQHPKKSFSYFPDYE